MARVRAEKRPVPKSRLLPASYSTERRWTDNDARTVLAAQAASGLSVAAFAAREKIDPQRLYFWRRRLDGAPETTAPAAFIEVRSPVRREVVEVELRSGHVIRVVESIDPRVLRRFVDALEQDGAC